MNDVTGWVHRKTRCDNKASLGMAKEITDKYRMQLSFLEIIDKVSLD